MLIICKSCKKTFTKTGRGRPPITCPDCKNHTIKSIIQSEPKKISPLPAQPKKIEEKIEYVRFLEPTPWKVGDCEKILEVRIVNNGVVSDIGGIYKEPQGYRIVFNRLREKIYHETLDMARAAAVEFAHAQVA